MSRNAGITACLSRRWSLAVQTDERSISTMGAWQALASDGAGYEGTVLLISTHAEEDVADLIAASPAAGFLLKAELSASAIRRVVDGSRW